MQRRIQIRRTNSESMLTPAGLKKLVPFTKEKQDE